MTAVTISCRSVSPSAGEGLLVELEVSGADAVARLALNLRSENKVMA